jgi:hypothetical protein
VSKVVTDLYTPQSYKKYGDGANNAADVATAPGHPRRNEGRPSMNRSQNELQPGIGGGR